MMLKDIELFKRYLHKYFLYRNIGSQDNKDVELEEEKSVTPDKGKDDHTTPVKGKPVKGSDKGSKEDKKERKKSAERKTATSKGTSRRNSMQVASPPPGASTPVSDIDAMRYVTSTRLFRFILKMKKMFINM